MFNLINRKLAESKGGRGMDLLKCRALVRAIELGSFSAAAAEMGYTPSGISHMAAAVEDELGVVLLRRGRSGVSLSPPGEMCSPPCGIWCGPTTGCGSRSWTARGW